MTLDQIRQDVNESMKKGDSVRVDTLRFLLAAIRNMAITKYGAAGESAVTEADVMDGIKKQAKAHRESVEAFTKANRPELAAKEQKELTILESFLPKEMSDEELKKLLEPIVAGGEKNFGLLMKAAMTAVQGKADGGRVSSILRTMV